MSGKPAVNSCPCCNARLVDALEFSLCPACGLIITDASGAAIEIAELRRQLRDSNEISLDVPNVLAALNEGAWWELSDAPATQFTAGSLARLIRAAGFEISALSRSADERHVHLTAARSAATTRPRLDLEDDLAAATAAVDAFPAVMERQVARWQRVIDEMLDEGKRVAIGGAGARVDAFFAKLLVDATRVDRVIDASRPPDVAIVLGDSVDDVRGQLHRLGLRPLVLTP